MQDEGVHARATPGGVGLVRVGMRQLSFIPDMYSRLPHYVNPDANPGRVDLRPSAEAQAAADETLSATIGE
jgi:hypothetical protein